MHLFLVGLAVYAACGLVTTAVALKKDWCSGQDFLAVAILWWALLLWVLTDGRKYDERRNAASDRGTA